jgi:uncharacterized protein YeaC (DUF1315 family)
MNFQDMLNGLTPDIYERLKLSVELGKWPDGRRLTSEQRQLCMQAMIAWEHKNLPPEQHSGYIAPEPHTHCGTDAHDDHHEPKPLKWL